MCSANCTRYQFSSEVLLITKLVHGHTEGDKRKATDLVYDARHGHVAEGLPRIACARPLSISPAAWISCMACVPKRQVPKV
jgi:hypothetical protein